MSTVNAPVRMPFDWIVHAEGLGLGGLGRSLKRSLGKTVTELLQSPPCLYPEPEIMIEVPRPALFGVRTKVD